MRYDYLYGTNYTIEQPAHMYHFNSDTEYLGRMMEVQPEETVLDIGTNTGALLCYIAHHKAIPYGIDVLEEVVETARKNMEHNHICAHIYAVRLQEFQGCLFDHAICNPPYFPTKKTDLKNDSPYLRMARHEDYLKLEELFRCSYSLVKEEGSLQIVHRYDRLQEIQNTAAKNGWFLRKFRIHYSSKQGIPKSVWCYFLKEDGKCIQYAPSYLGDRDSVERKEEI